MIEENTFPQASYVQARKYKYTYLEQIQQYTNKYVVKWYEYEIL